jgi:site-specific recombinase XerD
MRLPITFQQTGGLNHIYLDAYTEWLVKQPISSNTARAYRSRVKHFLVFLHYADLSDRLPLDEPSGLRDAMQSYLAFLKLSNKQGSTVNANINALNSFFQFLGIQPATCVRERCHPKTAKILTLDEQERFLKTVQRQYARDKALALILFYTGLRIGDCAKLEMQNIGPGAARIVLEGAVTIILNQETMLALRAWLEERKVLVGAGPVTGLWLTKKRTRLTMAGIAWVIERIGWQSGLIVSAEVLRRTRLTQASDSFSKDLLASKFGGHVGKATLKRYATPFATNFVSPSVNIPRVVFPSV